MNEIFSIEKTVTANEIDDLNHVNNVVYVNWMEEIATKHWQFLTAEAPLPDYIWVVLRHEIDYVQQAVLHDKITIKTWVGETKGFKSERLIAFYKDDVVIAKSKTIWGMLALKTYKPARITESVLNILHGIK